MIPIHPAYRPAASASSSFAPLRRHRLQAAALALVAMLLLGALAVGGPWAWWLTLAGALGCAVVAVYLVLNVPAHAVDPQAHERNQLVLEAVEQMPESFAVVGFDGELRYANRSFLVRSGYALQEVLGHAARDISANGMSSQQYVQMRSMVARGETWRGVFANRRKDGSEIQESVSISPIVDANNKVLSLVEFKQDITELLRARERLSQLLNFDTITMLPNRWALSAKLDGLLQAAPSYPAEPAYWHAFLLLDIDHFAKFNTARGIEWGDALLHVVAQRLVSVLPPNAWAARTTSDEFAVVLENAATSRTDARRMACALASELQLAMASHVLQQASMESVTTTFSIGITVFPFGEPARKRDAYDHIYQRSSMALLQAKKQGPGYIHAFSDSMVENTQRKLALEQGLREALCKDQLRVYVQTQVDIDGQVRGVEALVRWHHPESGVIAPGMFIPIAEESDLIVQLGEWMLDQALQLLANPLLRNSRIGVSINVSARQFSAPDFVERVAAKLKGKSIGMGRLTFEVTETVVLADLEQTILTMLRLQELGVQCALDDFGTGYSSLSYLRKLPVQEIKIDQSFIHDLDPDANSGTVVQAVLMVAKSMNLRVVAEGVETESHVDTLRAWHPAILCQGYFFSRPVPVEEWLATRVLVDALRSA